MAPTPEPPVFVEASMRCYRCGFESTNNIFKYYNNKKLDQPRYRCNNCKKLFTKGCHGRPQGKTYAKKRNQDPPELQGLPRDCCHCGVADNALFKYYNNKSTSQPRFQCLSCRNQFQMRLLEDGNARRLVHTSSKQRQPQSTWKMPALAPSCNSSNFDDAMDLQSDVMSAPVDPCASTAEYAPQLNDGDCQLWHLMEPSFGNEDVYSVSPMEAAWSDHMRQPTMSVDGCGLVNSTEAGFSNETNVAEAVNDVGMASLTTNDSLGVAQEQMEPSVSDEEAFFLSLFATEVSDHDMNEPSMSADGCGLLNIMEAGWSEEMNEVEAVKDEDMTPFATYANIGVAQHSMEENAPETFMDLMKSSLIEEDAWLPNFSEAGLSEEMNEVEALNDVDMTPSATNANPDVAQGQVEESAPEIFMGIHFLRW